MRPRTLLALARRRRIALPAEDEEGLREWFRFRDFDHFVEIYLACSRCLRDPEDFQRLLADFADDQASQRVRYCEVHFTIGTHWRNGANPGELLDALAESIGEAERLDGVTIRLIPDIVRDVPDAADLTLEWALAGQPRGVVAALGLSGREAVSPSAPFAEHFAEAARRGLHRVAHAGEHAGARSIRAVLDDCRAERIGHGVRALEDPALVATLRDTGVPLEVCPSSNVCLGVVPDLAHHPFDELRRAGLEVTVNTDDPPLFETSLSEEYLRLATTFGYDAETLVELAVAAARHAFLDESARRRLVDEIRAAASELAPRHLGRALTG